MPHKFTPFSDLEIPDKRRRNLPHWEVPGATYFLTFRLADALPAGVLEQINHSVDAWLRQHSLSDRREVQWLPQEKQSEFRRLITAEEEHWLDAGNGSCALRDSEFRQYLIEALTFFDDQRYALDAYVIMPNHVHLLVLPLESWSLSSIVASWKQYSAKRINIRMGRSGALWQKETFDHIVRNVEKLKQCRRYIAANPVKGRLARGDFHLGCGVGITT